MDLTGGVRLHYRNDSDGGLRQMVVSCRRQTQAPGPAAAPLAAFGRSRKSREVYPYDEAPSASLDRMTLRAEVRRLETELAAARQRLARHGRVRCPVCGGLADVTKAGRLRVHGKGPRKTGVDSTGEEYVIVRPCPGSRLQAQS